jgi:hypothetical protein
MFFVHSAALGMYRCLILDLGLTHLPIDSIEAEPCGLPGTGCSMQD